MWLSLTLTALTTHAATEQVLGLQLAFGPSYVIVVTRPEIVALTAAVRWLASLAAHLKGVSVVPHYSDTDCNVLIPADLCPAPLFAQPGRHRCHLPHVPLPKRFWASCQMAAFRSFTASSPVSSRDLRFSTRRASTPLAVAVAAATSRSLWSSTAGAAMSSAS